MYKLSLIIAFIFFCGIASASSYLADTSKSFTIHVAPFSGRGNQYFSYNIAGNEQGTNPNILSELIWKNNVTTEVGTDLYLEYQRFVLCLNYLHTNTKSGTVSDIDYAEDNRLAIFSEKIFSNHQGIGRTLELLLGYQLIQRSRYSLSIFLSYDNDKNSLYLLNQKHLSNQDEDYLPNLNSRYKYNCPSLGGTFNAIYHPCRLIEISLDTKLHHSFYKATGSWNLREDFAQPDSYIHTGQGIKASALTQIQIALASFVNIGIRHAYNTFQLRNGTDKLLLNNGIIQRTRLNQVHSKKNAIYMTINFLIH